MVKSLWNWVSFIVEWGAAYRTIYCRFDFDKMRNIALIASPMEDWSQLRVRYAHMHSLILLSYVNYLKNLIPSPTLHIIIKM